MFCYPAGFAATWRCL